MRNFSPFAAGVLLAAAVVLSAGEPPLQLRAAADRVDAFATVEFDLAGLPDYRDPFDPAVVDLRVEFTLPGGQRISVPAFFRQAYERRRAGEAGLQRDWSYPVGAGWQARYAPSRAGRYSAQAILKDARGETRSAPVTFVCVASDRRGFIRVSGKDPRFFEFDNGEPFFPIGQNLAFIGSQQYVTLSKAEEIFAKLATHGANYLRVWTGAEDWALAIEARKSAWSRSWGGKARIVEMPDDATRQCLLINSNNATQEVNPSHPVALRPSTRYVVTGKVRTETNTALRLEAHGSSSPQPLASARPLAWTEFRHEFTTGGRDWWLGPMRFRREGPGHAWLADLSLKEAAGGAELLWEAAMNRPARGFYNPLDSFLLDEIVAAAEQRGIYLQLCMLMRDLYMNALKDPASDEYTRAIADAKKFFRYAIARWGSSTSVAAWEYWNEMDPGLPTDRFYKELGEFFEHADVYRHLRSTSTWGPNARDARHGKLDLADVHFYLRPVDKPRLENEVDAVLDRVRWLREHAPRKPAILGEFGLADDKWRITDDMRRSADLSDVHNALWASALSGASGTALFWWWERIDQRNGYSMYRPLSQFLSGIPWNSGEVKSLDAKCSSASMRVVGLRADDRAWFWIFDPAAAWANVALEKQTPAERAGLTVELHGTFAPATRVTWWDTRTGTLIDEQSESSANTLLRLRVPPFRRDVACRLEAK